MGAGRALADRLHANAAARVRDDAGDAGFTILWLLRGSGMARQAVRRGPANGPAGALAAAQLRATSHTAIGARAAGRRAGKPCAAAIRALRSGLSVPDSEQSVLSPVGGRHRRFAGL